MKALKLTSIILLALFVSSFCCFFLNKPPLLQGLSFSSAVFDDSEHLLRLSLNQEDKYRLYVPLSKIPKVMQDASLLQEDYYFRQHFGVNPLALANAAFKTYLFSKRRFGASTITMQVARLRFGIHSKTILGKMEQILRALQLEMHYSKDEILEAYLNLAPYGGNIEGAGAASAIYFQKPIQEIGLAEALTLSVIPQNPSKRTLNQENLKTIRNKLFKRWLTKHPEDAEQKPLFELPLALSSQKDLPFLAPHFVNSLLKKRPRPQIHSTLNKPIQALLERTISQYVRSNNNLGVYNAAALLVDTRDMGVKGLLGSVNFFDKKISGQVNGTEMRRSPGSTLKPFIYALALDQGLIHPNTVLKDVPRSFGNYNPENFDYDFMGPVKARDALALSRNVPAIYLASQLGVYNLYHLLEKAHISSLKPEAHYGLALSLGGVEISMQELLGLYAMLVNEGRWQPLRMLKNEKAANSVRLLSPEASFLVLDMLKHHEDPLYNNLEVAWKTGTSSGFRDAWSIGSFGPYVLAIWVGNFNNEANPAFVGKNIAAPLFFKVLSAMQQEGLVPSFPKKDPRSMNLTRIQVCKASGLLPTRFCLEQEPSWFIPGKSPIKSDTVFREVAINAKTGLRACHFDEHTRFQIYEFWPSDLLKIFKQAGIPRSSPPLFEAGCLLQNSSKNIGPQINSLQKNLVYLVPSAKNRDKIYQNIIPLTAIAEADVRHLYWFANQSFLGKSSPMQTFYWKPQAGQFVIRVVDDHGLSDAKDVVVRYE